MKGKVLIVVLISIFSLGFVLANAYATEPMLKSSKNYEVSNLLSEYLENPQGGFLGRISDFLVDSNGHIDFAIVQVGFPEVGRDSRLIAVPFSALSRAEGKYYVLNVTRERLVSAPQFFEKRDLSNRALQKVFTGTLASNLPGQKEEQRNTQTLTVGEERLKDFRA